MSGNASPKQWFLTWFMKMTVKWNQPDSSERVFQKKESKNSVQPEDFLIGAYNTFQPGWEHSQVNMWCFQWDSYKILFAWYISTPLNLSTYVCTCIHTHIYTPPATTVTITYTPSSCLDRLSQCPFYYTHCLWALTNKALSLCDNKSTIKGILNARHS